MRLARKLVCDGLKGGSHSWTITGSASAESNASGGDVVGAAKLRAAVVRVARCHICGEGCTESCARRMLILGVCGRARFVGLPTGVLSCPCV